jgi:Fe-S-cluster containining protein
MMEHSVARCLSFHAAYRCHRSGACCSAGWTIPFDTNEVRRVTALGLPSGRLHQTTAGTFAAMNDRRCSFLEDVQGVHACAIHRAGGHGALPLTCRMFPRVVLHDRRGTFVSLSHFCPTAAGMLFDAARDVSIVDAPETLAGSDALDGLDARDVWPPLLRPGLMMDLDSYDLWERSAIALLTRDRVPPRLALDALESATARVVAWQVEGGTPLSGAVSEAFAGAVPARSTLARFEPAVNRWLAARLFGAWVAYQGNGLRTTILYLRACLDAYHVELARDGDAIEAIRRADRLIVHESSSQQLANLLNERS